MIGQVKIEQDSEKPYIHRIFIDGKEITRVNHIDFSLDLDILPQVNIGIANGSNFEGLANITFECSDYSSETLYKILCEELHRHGVFYEKLQDSIEAVLSEALPFETTSEIAKKILKRVIGEK